LARTREFAQTLLSYFLILSRWSSIKVDDSFFFL
jgi:hypothetical protein